jgi:hypothetical protein
MTSAECVSAMTGPQCSRASFPSEATALPTVVDGSDEEAVPDLWYHDL